ncbi:hypothetical protein ABIC02_007443 [Bradyrhizobium sp. RT5a]
MGPAQNDGTVDQPVLQLGALLMLPHLVDGRLPHLDIGELGTVRRREPFVSDVRADQHDPPPFRACRVSLALAVSARRGFEQSAFASRSTDSGTGAERRPPDGRAGLPKSAADDTQRDLEGVGGPSRITFSSRKPRFALKFSVRALMRGRPLKNRGALPCSATPPTPTPSSIASSTTLIGSISPAKACTEPGNPPERPEPV